MSGYPEYDLTTIKPQAFADRASKVNVKDFARPPKPGASFSEFIESFPNILAGPQLTAIARAVVSARRSGKSVIFSLGGHVVKTGISPVLIDLMRRGMISA